jgi:hypothetical protein
VLGATALGATALGATALGATVLGATLRSGSTVSSGPKVVLVPVVPAVLVRDDVSGSVVSVVFKVVGTLPVSSEWEFAVAPKVELPVEPLDTPVTPPSGNWVPVGSPELEAPLLPGNSGRSLEHPIIPILNTPTSSRLDMTQHCHAWGESFNYCVGIRVCTQMGLARTGAVRTCCSLALQRGGKLTRGFRFEPFLDRTELTKANVRHSHARSHPSWPN